MARSRPPRTHRYSMQFKATAVRLSELPDVLIQDVAAALDIHPFMLSRWRKQAREGLIVTKGVKLDMETAGLTSGVKAIRGRFLPQRASDLIDRFGMWGMHAVVYPASEVGSQWPMPTVKGTACQVR